MNNQTILFHEDPSKVYNGITRTDKPVYPVFHSIFQSMQKRAWVPEAISMSLDKAKFKQHPKGIQEIITANIGWQVYGDSDQDKNLEYLKSHCNNIELKRCIGLQIAEEDNHCYEEGTEVLTSKGFKDFRDVTLNDLVANYWEDQSITYSKPSDLPVHDFDGELVQFQNEGKYSLSVSPNHRMVYRQIRPTSKWAAGDLRITEASETSLRNYDLPIAGFSSKGAHVLTAEDRMAIAFQADGTLISQLENGEYSYRFSLKRPDKIKRIQFLAKVAGLRITVKECKSKSEGFHSIYLWSERLYDKEFSWVNLQDVNHEWGSAFLTELAQWDGSDRPGPNSILYSNTNLHALDMVEAIAATSGWQSGRISCPNTMDRLLPSGKKPLSSKPFYQIHLVQNKVTKTGRVANKSRKRYIGKIYSATVPSGMLIVRYQGNVAVSGNSGSYQYVINSMYDNPSKMLDGLESNKALQVRRSLTTDTGKLDSFSLHPAVKMLGLEGISFTSSFLTTLTVNHHFPIPGTHAQILKIAADEAGHLVLWSQVVRILLKQGIIDPDTISGYIGYLIEVELDWFHYLGTLYQVPELTHNRVMAFLQWKADQVARGVGLKSIYNVEPNSIATWYQDAIKINSQSTEGQAGDNTAYVTGGLKHDW